MSLFPDQSVVVVVVNGGKRVGGQRRRLEEEFSESSQRDAEVDVGRRQRTRRRTLRPRDRRRRLRSRHSNPEHPVGDDPAASGDLRAQPHHDEARERKVQEVLPGAGLQGRSGNAARL